MIAATRHMGGTDRIGGVLQAVLLLCLALGITGCAIHPKPLTTDEIEARADRDLAAMFQDQEPVDGPVDLYTAMARAVKYNLDYRLRLMEQVLSRKNLDVSRYDLLPELAASAGYNHRSEYHGANSIALTGPRQGQESLITSTSQEKDIRTADITVTWNVLDFALGYYRARQQADEVLVAEETRRRVIQGILRDVRYAFWRAAGTRQLLDEMEVLLQRAQSAYERSKEATGRRLQPPLVTMAYQRELLDNIRILWGLIRTLATAKTELATLMNVRPGTSFDVAAPGVLSIPAVAPDMASLEETAMQNRPELREEDYKSRISALEVRKTVVGMLPGLNLRLGYDYDSNDLLYRNNWWSAGAGISMNLLNLLSGPATYRAAKARQEVDRVRRQAVGMAVMAQVHIAYQRYALATEEYRITRELTDVDEDLTAQMQAEQTAGRVTELALIQTATNAMVSRVRSRLAYAELQNATGRIYTSLGIDLMPETVASLDVKTLARSLEESWATWEKQVSP